VWVASIIIVSIGGLVVYYVYNPKRALTLVFPDLSKVRYIDAVIKNDSVYTDVLLVLENKNPYKLIIDTVAFDVKLNDTSIAYEVIPLRLDQSGFAKDTVSLPLNLDAKKIRRIIKNLQSQDSTDIEAVGYVVYETIFGRVKFDFNRKSRIQVPVPPKIKIVRMERKSFRLKDKVLSVNAIIEIINEGKNLDLRLSGVHYELDVKNTLHSEGVIKQEVVIKPKSSVTLVLPMEIEVFHPLKTLWLIKTDNDRLPYKLSIKGMITENMSENSFASPAEVKAEGTMELKKEKSPN
jgi:LEA14-like dessication related protein